ncbi:Uncharacterized protein dnm_015060 [Desulfonema magnum]|uniref:Uncharacterized protein n=1 Tax=Desulfonema magnum TaxID=45655 RepID=A0A975BI58_9BACT|nr:Uncharacterized protein dnm_015060 [Desulfonema magnum]
MEILLHKRHEVSRSLFVVPLRLCVFVADFFRMCKRWDTPKIIFCTAYKKPLHLIFELLRTACRHPRVASSLKSVIIRFFGSF